MKKLLALLLTASLFASLGQCGAIENAITSSLKYALPITFVSAAGSVGSYLLARRYTGKAKQLKKSHPENQDGYNDFKNKTMLAQRASILLGATAIWHVGMKVGYLSASKTFNTLIEQYIMTSSKA